MPRAARLAHQRVEVVEGAEVGIDVAVVGDVVAPVPVGRAGDRREPEPALDARPAPDGESLDARMGGGYPSTFPFESTDPSGGRSGGRSKAVPPAVRVAFGLSQRSAMCARFVGGQPGSVGSWPPGGVWALRAGGPGAMPLRARRGHLHDLSCLEHHEEGGVVRRERDLVPQPPLHRNELGRSDGEPYLPFTVTGTLREGVAMDAGCRRPMPETAGAGGERIDVPWTSSRRASSRAGERPAWSSQTRGELRVGADGGIPPPRFWPR